MRRFLLLVLLFVAGNVATGCSQKVEPKGITPEEAAAMVELHRELDRLQREYAELSVEKFKR